MPVEAIDDNVVSENKDTQAVSCFYLTDRNVIRWAFNGISMQAQMHGFRFRDPGEIC